MLSCYHAVLCTTGRRCLDMCALQNSHPRGEPSPAQPATYGSAAAPGQGDCTLCSCVLGSAGACGCSEPCCQLSSCKFKSERTCVQRALTPASSCSALLRRLCMWLAAVPVLAASPLAAASLLPLLRRPDPPLGMTRLRNCCRLTTLVRGHCWGTLLQGIGCYRAWHCKHDRWQAIAAQAGCLTPCACPEACTVETPGVVQP